MVARLHIPQPIQETVRNINSVLHHKPLNTVRSTVSVVTLRTWEEISIANAHDLATSSSCWNRAKLAPYYRLGLRDSATKHSNYGIGRGCTWFEVDKLNLSRKLNTINSVLRSAVDDNFPEDVSVSQEIRLTQIRDKLDDATCVLQGTIHLRLRWIDTERIQIWHCVCSINVGWRQLYSIGSIQCK